MHTALPPLFHARCHLTLEGEMKKRILCFAFLAAVAASMLACSASETPPSSTNTASSPVENKAALASITSDDLLKHIKTLASDEFEGRAPGTKGEELTVNDPAIPDPSDPNKLDDKMFKGKAMTYYGRWTYKFEIASEKGAAAAIIVHETGPAGYPFAALASWRQENFDIKAADKNMNRVSVESWIIDKKARELFAAAG